jgi:hypothetical protein
MVNQPAAANSVRQVVETICERMINEENRGAIAGLFFDKLMAPGVCFRRANGEVACKPSFIAGLEPNSQNAERSLDGDVEVQIYGAIAVASLRVKVTSKKDSSERLYRNIRVFLRNPEGGETPEEQWQLHMWFNEEIPPAA